MNLQSYMRIDKSVYQAKIESMSSIDPAWLVRFIAHTRTLVALGMWQDYRLTDVAEQFVQTLDNAPVQLQSKPGRQLPIQRFLKKAVRYNFAAGAIPLKHLLTPVITDLCWQQNPNYDDPNFLETYGFVELIGPDGYATTDQMRMGLLFLAPNTHYEMHDHAAEELYYVLSGQARFGYQDRPKRTCPAGIYIHHKPNEPHSIETKDEWLLALYLWRGDVVVHATLTDS